MEHGWEQRSDSEGEDFEDRIAPTGMGHGGRSCGAGGTNRWMEGRHGWKGVMVADAVCGSAELARRERISPRRGHGWKGAVAEARLTDNPSRLPCAEEGEEGRGRAACVEPWMEGPPACAGRGASAVAHCGQTGRRVVARSLEGWKWNFLCLRGASCLSGRGRWAATMEWPMEGITT